MKKKKQIKPTLHSLDSIISRVDIIMEEIMDLINKKNNKGVK
tara:strand:- start:11234 stop:11359 length:126 start_codon:yes stop_codon:yes gene_type:complete